MFHNIKKIKVCFHVVILIYKFPKNVIMKKKIDLNNLTFVDLIKIFLIGNLISWDL